MRKTMGSVFFTSFAFFLIVACATKPEPSPAISVPPEAPIVQAIPEPGISSIQAESTGLAPSGDVRYQTIDFAILFGNGESVTAWSLAIVDQKLKTPVRTIKGGGSDLPDQFQWDGMSDSGSLAPEGMYVALLSVEYGGVYKTATAISKPFLLDITPPTAYFSPNPARFAYAPDGVPAPIALSIVVKSRFAAVAKWDLDVFDADGTQVKSFSGGKPTDRLSWDGKLETGGYVETAKSYPAVLTVADEFGNSGSYKGTFAAADVPKAEASAITVRRSGFSPTGAGAKNTLDLFLSIGSKASAKSWQVAILHVGKGIEKNGADILKCRVRHPRLGTMGRQGRFRGHRP